MDPDLRRSWKRPLHFLTLYFILIYQAHLSWGVTRGNISNWNEFNNGSSRIKQQKWDTASQGGQDLQTTAAAFEKNTSASSRSLVSRTVVSNVTPIKIEERAQNFSWTLSFDKSSAVTGESSQTSSRTIPASQKVLYTSAGSTIPASQSLSGTAQSSQSQTNPVLSSQSPTPSQTTPSNQLLTETAQLNQSQTSIESTIQSQTTVASTSQSSGITRQISKSSSITTDTNISPSSVALASQSSPETAQLDQAPTNTESSIQSPKTEASTHQSTDSMRQTIKLSNPTTKPNISPSNVSSKSSNETVNPSQLETSPMHSNQQRATTSSVSQSRSTTQASQLATTTESYDQMSSTKVISIQPTTTVATASQTYDITKNNQLPLRKTTNSHTPSNITPSSQSPKKITLFSQPPATPGTTASSLGRTLQTRTTATTKEPSGQLSTIQLISDQSVTTVASASQPSVITKSSQLPHKKQTGNQALSDITRPSQSPNKRTSFSQPPTTTGSTNPSPGRTLQTSITATTTESSIQLSTTQMISTQTSTTVASASQRSGITESSQVPWSKKAANQTPINVTPPSQFPNKKTTFSQPSITTGSTSQLPGRTVQPSKSATTTDASSQWSAAITSASKEVVIKTQTTFNSTTPTEQTSTTTTLTSTPPGKLMQTSKSFLIKTPSIQSQTTTMKYTFSKSTTSSQEAPTKTKDSKQLHRNSASTTSKPVSQSNTVASIQPGKKTKLLSQSKKSAESAKKSTGSSSTPNQTPPTKEPAKKLAPKKATTSQSTSSTKSGQSLRTTETVYSTERSSNSSQLSSSQTSLSQPTTASKLSSQSSPTTTFSNQSPATLIAADQSVTNSVTLHQISHSSASNNQSLPKLVTTDQSLNSSLSSEQSTSGSTTLGNSVSGAFSREEHPVNVSLLTRQAKEALKSLRSRIPGETCEYPCLNGGQCIRSGSCDCSLFQATGHRCQTVPNTGFEREMTCRTWGQYNFETFDGLYFYFPGRCTYTLLRDCEETTQASIVVQVHNDPSCSSAPYTCRRSVSLFLPWEGEIQLHTTNVTFKGQSLQLPHHIHDLQLDQISQYVVVTQQQGFTLAWEGRSGSIYIKLSPEFVGRTCGLCGNFNADVQDDLKTSYGVLTRDIEMFGNSWMEAEPHQGRCPTVPSGFSSPCAHVDAHVLLEVEEVCAMLLDPPFQSCHDFVSPLSFMASCSNDLCRSGPSGDMVCQVFSEYARACAHADHPLHNWRGHIPQCVKQCPLGLQYRECISCCPESCNLERTCIDSKLACLDGCYCPDGLIYEDGSCVAPADCPCEYHGMFYPSGQMLQEECNNCTCVGGVWSCTDYSCPGECSVTGDMYFQSFDGRIFTFPATCQYVLAKSRNSGKFTITIQNAPCGANLDGACIQSVSLVIDEDPRTEITLSHVGEVFMAGQYRISLPYSDDIFHVQELSSMFLQVRTAFGLRLQYSWAEFRLYLQIEELWKDDTVGLCGTFNGNIQDDFLSPSGMIESTPQLFGNTWKVSSACSLSLSTPQLDPCDTHQQAVTYASEMCEVLNQDLFSACHEYFSPTPFYQQCRSDTCKCGTPCLCSALAHYARHCRRFSIIVDFRSHVSDCAVACPATMQYGTCVSSCQRRCSSLSVSQHCGEDCEEGCTCPQGSFYNHRTQTCVHRSECPCSFLGADYEPGDVIMTSAGVQLCLNGKLVSQTTETDGLCPPGQLFQNCSDRENNFLSGRGVACERTCESYLLNITCSVHEPCVSGCACPPGLLKHGDECFEPAACPCLWKGKEYFPGDRVSSPCYQCICQHGTFQCVFPPCPSMCTAYGDRHYRTFDGLLFDYVGACKVYLVKSSADVMLSVTAENIDCFDTGVICRKSLLINIERSFILFDDDSGKPNPSSVIDRKQQMFIWPAGFFTVIHFPEEDVTILWDRKTTVHIQVGPRWQGKLSGLCGDFDLKTVNEMRTPDNIDSATPQEFGNSWTATECVNSPDIRHPCSLSPLREPFAKRQCAVLLSEVFQTCHPVVDVTWFYMNCLADTCACSRGGDCECFCTSVAAYAQRCCHEGIPIDWRSPSLCPYDCEFYNKVLGKGPLRLFTFRDQTTLLSASRSSGFVFLQRVNTSTATTAAGVLSQFMMTPGLSRARPHDSSRVSFEAADRPNFFLHASPSGQVRLAKWQESEVFWDGATFVLHRNTWIPGYDSLESHAKPGFFLHATLPHLHLLKFRHSYSFRKATLFRLTGPSPDTPPSPRCQWRYDSCVSPCFKTCSDPSAEACVTIPRVEGCLPFCPPHMVLDEVTRRCVHVEDCIKVPTIVPLTTLTTASVTSATSTNIAASTSPLTVTISPTAFPISPHTGTTVKVTPKIPSVSPHTTSSKLRETTTSSKTPELVRTPSTPTEPSAVRPEVVEPPYTVGVTEAPSTALTGATKWTTKPTNMTIGPYDTTTSRTSSIAADTSSTKLTDSPQLFFTTTAVTTTAAQTTTSAEGPTTIRTTAVVHQKEDATKTTTRSTASSPVPAPVSGTSVVSDITTVSSTITSVEMGTSTKTTTVEEITMASTATTPPLIRPGLPSTSSTTVSPAPVSPPIETGTGSLSTVTSAKTTESLPPVLPFTTSKITETSQPVTTETIPTDQTTSTVSVLPTTLIHVTLSTTSSFILTSAAAEQQTTTKKVTVPESPASRIPTVSTVTAALPSPKVTDTTTSALSTSAAYTDRTSWSAPVPVTVRTTISRATSSPLVVPETSTMSSGLLFTTKPSTETTAVPPSPTTKSYSHPVFTELTSEPWRPPDWKTSSTPIYRPTVEITSEVIHVVTSTKTTEVPHAPVTSKLTFTSSTSPAVAATTAQTTTQEVSTPETGSSTAIKLVTPPPSPVPGSPETSLTTAPTRATPSAVTTTLKPVVIQPITETKKPVTDRVQVSTKSTTMSSPSLSPVHTTTSAAAPNVTTVLDKLTTRLVTSRATPTTTSTTIVQTTTFRTTPRIPMTTRVPPRATSTTIRPVTARVTMATRPSAITTRSTTLGSPTVAPATTSGVTFSTIMSANMTEHVHASAPSPRLTTTTTSVLVPTRTTTTSSIVVPARESTTPERTLSTKEVDVQPATSQLPDIIVSTHEASTPGKWVEMTSPPSATTVQWSHASPGEMMSSASTSVHTPRETTSHSAERSTSVTAPPMRMCTPPYAEIIDECTRYICVNNQLVLFNKSQSCPFTAEPPNCGLLGFAVQVNGDKCCPKWDCPCRCSMFPDLNVITFDGNSFAIYKAASYVVTQLSNETLSVLVQECSADSESPLMWNFTNLCLVSLNITHKSNHVVIDRLQRRLYINSRYARPRFKKHGFEIYDTGNMYLIRSPSGLKVQWYHSTGMMVIDTDSSNKKLPTMGLCGFCDGDPTNDMTLPNGTTLGVSEALFIDSWQVPNTTSYVSYSRRREHNCSTSDCSHCLAMLENPAFTSCHAFVPPSLFCEVWVRDSEYVNNQCIALAAYVASCHKFNICIEWRSPDYCPFACPDTLQYQACLPACTSQSCPNHDFDSDPDQCSGLTEGCVCPEGTLLHRPYSALCIPHEKCACTDGSGAPRAHGEVWTASKDGCCMYRCDNDTIVPVEFNCSSMPAPVCHRTGEMIINMADDTSCCPHKICMCNQSLCDQLPPECKYGEKLVSYYRSDSCCPEHVCECDPDLCESTIIPTCRDDQTLIATRADGSCCIAHICTCSSCVKTRPICLDGEVLTVDSNVTDRCCPAYQCVCQPYRCPQLSCPVGMSVVSVSSPDRCCPNQTCECSCEKIISPKCGLGEAAQLDRAFLSDPQNHCACKRYKCVREAVCVFGERGVLRPGQTLVEHEDNGLCYSRQCSRILDPTSGFYLLRTSTVNCSTHCQPNQIYVPPKDQSTCCGVCKNISCLYQHENGTTGLYKPGKSWVSNCMKFDCTDTLLGPTLISYSFSCPPFNETECIKIGGTVVSYMDGCCKTCKEDGKSCQKVTVRMTIRKNDCRSNRPVNIVSCDGKCPSASIYNYNINTYARFCKCCRETGLQRRSVQLYCSSNSTWVSYTIQEPTDCSCQWS
ncbi:otogelin [Kryptolebias marmoratus]|uniref:otogelin n=1 Tax=Kryptolebias marmoratus TaxID=37003 RepID=UPI000D530578|nr:otogelin [Kryptolebias marmoratus]